MMAKCVLCDKRITKRSSGLECSKCVKIIHANQLCSGLSAKQLTAIRNSECIDWSCEECNRITPTKKSSFIVPEEEEEDNEETFGQGSGTNTFDTSQLLRDISAEMKKVLRKETEVIEESINRFGKKVDDLGTKMEVIGEKFRDMERKQNNLEYRNKHIEMTMGSLDFRVRKMEQDVLDTKVEIAGIPMTKNEALHAITCNIAKLLNVNEENIVNVQRTGGRPDNPILVELSDPELAAAWARAAKRETQTQPILAEHVVPDIPQESAKSKVFVRRALTKANKTLLWNAQQKLRPTFKYVWFQGGKVLARKDDTEKPIAIWCEEDITQITE